MASRSIEGQAGTTQNKFLTFQGNGIAIEIQKEKAIWVGLFMEGFKEDLSFKLSPNGETEFELAEKTGTSKGRKVKLGRVDWVGQRGETREGIYRAAIECQVFSPLSHFIF